MTFAARATPHIVSAEGSLPAAFLRQSLAVAAAELRKVGRDPSELLTRAIQPALWLVVFGQVFSRIRAIPTGNVSYIEFLAPGILAQSVLFSAIFFGIAVIWERDLGVIHKLLVSPAYRGALVLGKAISAGVRGLTQAVIIYALALSLGVRLQWGPASLVGVAVSVMLGSALFATFSLVVACLVKTRERFMGIGQVMTMPLFFASNAIYPLDLMPRWLQVVARANPLSYVVDLLRGLMIQGGHAALGLGTDFAVQIAGFLLLLLVASRLYPGLAR